MHGRMYVRTVQYDLVVRPLRAQNDSFVNPYYCTLVGKSYSGWNQSHITVSDKECDKQSIHDLNNSASCLQCHFCNATEETLNSLEPNFILLITLYIY